MLIAQITDLHVTSSGRLAYGQVDTVAALEAAVAGLNALSPQPDLVVATGDLVDLGTAEEYALLRAILGRLKAPVFVIPGNHDARDALGAAFGADGYLPAAGEYLHYTLEDWPLRLIALDTLVPGEGHGALDAARLDWLARRLAEQPERPTIVLMHHPPFPTGIAHMDAIGLLEGADALGALVAQNPAIERVLCGHVHRAIQARWHGTIASIAPSTAHQVRLDLSADAPSSFMLEPPGYQLHLWREGVGIVSHTASIGRFAGPYPFFDPEGELLI
ncbi:MAG TPA: phosphodiesterase [Alphaproteobacteria bacterium]|nr:phosphodiesterase [Alphaproteobacteria bacterium]